jgi:hypothetical protein
VGLTDPGGLELGELGRVESGGAHFEESVYRGSNKRSREGGGPCERRDG